MFGSRLAVEGVALDKPTWEAAMRTNVTNLSERASNFFGCKCHTHFYSWHLTSSPVWEAFAVLASGPCGVRYAAAVLVVIAATASSQRRC